MLAWQGILSGDCEWVQDVPSIQWIFLKLLELVWALFVGQHCALRLDRLPERQGENRLSWRERIYCPCRSYLSRKLFSTVEETLFVASQMLFTFKRNRCSRKCGFFWLSIFRWGSRLDIPKGFHKSRRSSSMQISFHVPPVSRVAAESTVVPARRYFCGGSSVSGLLFKIEQILAVTKHYRYSSLFCQLEKGSSKHLHFYSCWPRLQLSSSPVFYVEATVTKNPLPDAFRINPSATYAMY